MMLVVGLTGGIATGKSTVAAYLESKGALRFDADACVHRLLSTRHDIIKFVAAHFQGVVVNGAVDRPALGATVFHDDVAMKQLEGILHPAVRAEEVAAIEQGKQLGAKMVLLDIPLLFETEAHLRCDVTIATDCSAATQRERALQRPHMTQEKLGAILARQLSAPKRNALADYVIDTDGTWEQTHAQLDSILKEILA